MTAEASALLTALKLGKSSLPYKAVDLVGSECLVVHETSRQTIIIHLDQPGVAKTVRRSDARFQRI